MLIAKQNTEATEVSEVAEWSGKHTFVDSSPRRRPGLSSLFPGS